MEQTAVPKNTKIAAWRDKASFRILIRVIILGFLLTSILIGLNAIVVPQEKDGHDRRIISDLSQLRSIAEVTFGEEGLTYSRGLTCKEPEAFDDVIKLCKDIKEVGKTELIINLSSERDQYCAFAKLHSQEGRHFVWQKGKDIYYCVDSTGIAGFTTTNPGSNIRCPEGTE